MNNIVVSDPIPSVNWKNILLLAFSFETKSIFRYFLAGYLRK